MSALLKKSKKNIFKYKNIYNALAISIYRPYLIGTVLLASKTVGMANLLHYPKDPILNIE
jgi:hypothetical protein